MCHHLQAVFSPPPSPETSCYVTSPHFVVQLTVESAVACAEGDRAWCGAIEHMLGETEHVERWSMMQGETAWCRDRQSMRWGWRMMWRDGTWERQSIIRGDGAWCRERQHDAQRQSMRNWCVHSVDGLLALYVWPPAFLMTVLASQSAGPLPDLKNKCPQNADGSLQLLYPVAWRFRVAGFTITACSVNNLVTHENGCQWFICTSL